MGSIVFVESDERIRHIARCMLEKHDFTVYEAESGQDGIDLIKKFQPDLVITDLFTPQLGGIEIIRHARERRPELPVIAICRFKEAPYLKVAKHLGAFSGLCKPFNESELLTVVQDALHAAGQTESAERVASHA